MRDREKEPESAGMRSLSLIMTTTNVYTHTEILVNDDEEARESSSSLILPAEPWQIL